jgi:L-cysteine:1D-myo-inositol 2-amino-2-deoxy-alpha-D-glucopyranoside ligase
VAAESVTGVQFARHWMHTGMVRLDGEKMSKSLGNLVFVSDLLRSYDAAAIRLAILSHHYHDSWEWRDEALEKAKAQLESWALTGPGEGALDAVRERLDDDLDTPGALEAIAVAAARGEGVSAALALLGA